MSQARSRTFTPKQPLPAPGETGETYLIHLDQPVAHARHYTGWQKRAGGNREARHQSGNGARLLATARARGIAFRVVRTWPGTDRRFERQLKNYAHAPRLCPVCSPDSWMNQMPGPVQKQTQ